MTKKNLFYYIYFGAVILFAVLLIIGLIVLYNFLKTYESSQPKSIAQTICDDYLKNGELLKLKEQYSLQLSDYETGENAKSVFLKAIEGKQLGVFHSSQVPEGSELCFAIKADDEPVAFVALSKKEEKMSFGMSAYKVDSIRLSDDIYKSALVLFPSNAVVSVNGKQLSDDDVLSASMPEIDGVTFGDDAVYSCSAQIDNLLDSNIKVTVENSDQWNIVTDENSYAVEQHFDEKTSSEIMDFALEGAKVYAAHMQDAAPLAKVAKYVDSKSAFYKNIANTIVSFALTHDSASYDKVLCSSLMRHSDDIYSCRIKFTFHLTRGKRVSNDFFDKRVYVRVSGKTKKIIDMQSIG